MDKLHIIVLLLFGLFHHAKKPSPDVNGFIVSVVPVVMSYDDGSFNAEMEQGRIMEIEQNLYQLSREQQEAAERKLMDTINTELEELHAFDNALQERESI